jgi:hypothetical protein
MMVNDTDFDEIRVMTRNEEESNKRSHRKKKEKTKKYDLQQAHP